MEFNKKLPSRFWPKVDRKESGCWLWNANKNNKGYGMFHVIGNKKLAHRISWQLRYGEIPEGMHVLHLCNTPACVKPTHLFLGTHQENMQDKLNHGRAHYTSNKFSEETRKLITSMRGARQSVNKIAAAVGCDKATIVRYLKKHNQYQTLKDYSPYPPTKANLGGS